MTDTAPAPTADNKRRQAAARAASPRPRTPRAQGAAPRPRKVNPVLERLFELYPKMFGARFLPLKLGVFQDLLALHPDEFKHEDLKIALGLHARSTRYLEAVAAGEKRHDLNGVPVEHVAPEHVHHAILEVFRRRQARTDEDLRPKLRARLVEAIEASGLSREDYVLAVRTHDEAIERGARRGLRRDRRAHREARGAAARLRGQRQEDAGRVRRDVRHGPGRGRAHARRAQAASLQADQRRAAFTFSRHACSSGSV